MKKRLYNDELRQQAVDNDKYLYIMWRSSGVGQTRWVKENRELIDSVLRGWYEE